MSDLVSNPAYESATYELRFSDETGELIPDAWPKRFNEVPEAYIWGETDKLLEWLKHHAIPPFLIQCTTSQK